MSKLGDKKKKGSLTAFIIISILFFIFIVFLGTLPLWAQESSCSSSIVGQCQPQLENFPLDCSNPQPSRLNRTRNIVKKCRGLSTFNQIF